MRLRLVELLPPPGVANRIAVEFGADLCVVHFDDERSREFFADSLFSGLGGCVPRSNWYRQTPSLERHRRRTASFLGLPKIRPSSTEKESSPPYKSAYIAYEASNGMAFGVSVNLIEETFTTKDLDTNETFTKARPPVPGNLPFEAFQALSRISDHDVQLAKGSLAQALRAWKKAALQAGCGNALPVLHMRAIDSIKGTQSVEWSPPLPSLTPLARLRAVELDAEQAATARIAADHELQKLSAAAGKKRQLLDELFDEREKTEYLLLRTRYKQVSKRVERIDDLIAQIQKLESDPLPPQAELALQLAPRIERLIAQLSDARSEFAGLLKKIPSDRSDISALERELLQIEEELSLLSEAPPIGPELEEVITKIYSEWRRLCTEAEAAEFASRQALADAYELDTEPSEDVQRLACVTTADRLRSRLAARTAAASELQACRRRHADIKDSVEAEIASSGFTLAEAISSTRILRTPIEKLAAIENASLAREEAEKTAALIPWYRFWKRRNARKIVDRCRRTEKWLLAEEGLSSTDKLYQELEQASLLYRCVEPLSSTTFDLAHLAARLAHADTELSEQAGGIAGEELPTLVDELEAHQKRVCAALEIRREAEIAAEAARSLRAARDAAATELLARLHPLGITESDPAMAWSRFRLLAEGWRKKKELDSRFAAISAQLEPYFELRENLEECKARRDDLVERVQALLSRIAGCETGSLEERIANFAHLRDAALLERKLAAARSHLYAQLEEVCKRMPAEHWRKELVEIEGRLSELEADHPAWKSLEVACPQAVLEEKLTQIDLSIRSVQTSLNTIEAKIEACKAEISRSGSDHIARLFEVRNHIKKLGSLCKRFEALNLDHSMMSVESIEAEAVPVLEESMLAEAVGASKTSVGVPSTVYREANSGVVSSIPAGRLRAVGQSLNTDNDPSSAESPMLAYMTARAALLLGCGPAEEQLPLIVDGAIDWAPTYEKKDVLSLLDQVSAATQVVVFTSDPDIADLANAFGAQLVRVENLEVRQ